MPATAVSANVNTTDIFVSNSTHFAFGVDGSGNANSHIVFNGTNLVIDSDSDAGSGGAIILDSGGNGVGIGTTSPAEALDVVGNAKVSGNLTASGDVAVDTDTLFVDVGNDRVGIGTATPVEAFQVVGNSHFGDAGGGTYPSNTDIAVYRALGARPVIRLLDDTNDSFIEGGQTLRFGTFNSLGTTVDMELDANGNLLIGTTDTQLFNKNGNSLEGAGFINDELAVATWERNCGYFNRMGTDGEIVRFFAQGTQEGSISVSGTTVSYNGAHLSRWSQLPEGGRASILRGTILANLDEMCVWPGEENEQLNRMKVSDVAADKNVAGVFQSWDDEDGNDDFTCAMTGDFIIRIGSGVQVHRGDLIESAGDGTGRPQADDIVRSSTVAKVTSSTRVVEYADGSYCVPCVLMAC